LILRPPIDENS
jgi:hypothetical protein